MEFYVLQDHYPIADKKKTSIPGDVQLSQNRHQPFELYCDCCAYVVMCIFKLCSLYDKCGC